MSSLEKCLFRSAIFLIGLFACFILSSMSCSYILEINPLLVNSFANIFSNSEGCFFILFMVYFAVSHKLWYVVFLFLFISKYWDRGQEEKGMTEDEMAGWHHRLNAREFG